MTYDRRPEFSCLLKNGSIVQANHQTQGRGNPLVNLTLKGRGSNTWSSSQGCLQFSLLLKNVQKEYLCLYQCIMALCLVKAIERVMPTVTLLSCND
jgi:biotin-(acetyl-CoA carboxylase) ligase